jgi:hypothetical protein
MSPRRPPRDDDVPEADRLEQATPFDGGDAVDEAADDAEGVERFGTGGGAAPAVGDLPADVPEADALEQATPVDDGDDDWDDRSPT